MHLMMKLNCSERGSPEEQQLKGGMMTTGGVLCPKGGKQRCWLGDLPFLSQLLCVAVPLCGSPSGITQLIFTFLLTSDLAHPLNRPNGIPQIPPCPVLVRSPSLPLPASLSLFLPSGAWGGKFNHFWNKRKKLKATETKKDSRGTSLVVQRLGLCVSTAGGTRSNPGSGTKISEAAASGQRNKKRKLKQCPFVLKL